MQLGASRIAKRRQQIAHAAMCMNMAGIYFQRRLEVLARGRLLADEEQQIGKIDVAVGIVRMMPHRLREQRARGLAVSGIEHQRAEIVQRGEVGRLAADKFQIIALGILKPALFPQQTGAFGARLDGVRVVLHHAIELLQAQVSGSAGRAFGHDS